MTKILKDQILKLIFINLLFFVNPVFAVDLFEYGDENVIWQSGLNRYLKYAEQDDTSFGKNDHPVDLDPKNIANALRALEVHEEGGFFKSESIEPVFTIEQITLLAKELAKGLKNAKPDQDIIFALEKIEAKLLKLADRRLLAGRAFYKDGKLNIIIGEYDFFRSKAFESTYDPGRGEVPYNLNNGSRTRASKAFEGEPVNEIAGIENKKLRKFRYDWFVIDVNVASEAYIAGKQKKQNPKTVNDKQLEIEAAKLAKQRREMRAEMARMRKEIEDMSKNGDSSSSSAKSVEERMATLDELLDKKLITKEEYDTKRQEILNDI